MKRRKISFFLFYVLINLMKIKLNINEYQRGKGIRFMIKVINISLFGSYVIPKFKFFTVRLKNVQILMDRFNS